MNRRKEKCQQGNRICSVVSIMGRLMSYDVNSTVREVLMGMTILKMYSLDCSFKVNRKH